MDPEGVKELVMRAFPGATIEVTDLTGTFDHFQIQVVSPAFQDKKLVDQHRMVQASVQEALADGRIHAIQIKTSVPK